MGVPPCCSQPSSFLHAWVCSTPQAILKPSRGLPPSGSTVSPHKPCREEREGGKVEFRRGTQHRKNRQVALDKRAHNGTAVHMRTCPQTVPPPTQDQSGAYTGLLRILRNLPASGKTSSLILSLVSKWEGCRGKQSWRAQVSSFLTPHTLSRGREKWDPPQ